MPETNICKFRDEPRGRIPLLEELSVSSKAKGLFGPSAIIIDNGSYECRAGYAAHDNPSLIFKSVAVKQKSKGPEPDTILVGLDIENLETMRSQLKSPFDRNVVTQFDVQEMVFDYIFSKLKVSSREKVDHPVFISETVANPNQSRKSMSELLFECYSVPAVGYYVDAMASWYNQMKSGDRQTGIVISIGYQALHVCPVIEGIMDITNVRRVSLGGYHLDYFMQRLLQLKYPIHAASISLSRSEEVVQTCATVATDYKEACQNWLDVNFYDRQVKKMQLPYGNVPANFAAVAMQGEIQVERAKLNKEKQNLEKLEDKQHIYDQLCAIKELTGPKLYRRLGELGVDSLGELQCHIKAVQATVEDLKRKLVFKDEFNKGLLTKESLQKKIDDLDNPAVTSMSSFDIAEYYQLHVGLEQVRVPELLFQPSMIGVDQGGITETLAYVLSKYPMDVQNTLANNVLLTGGCASIPGIRDRVEADLRSIRPFKSDITVAVSSDPVYDTWKGARKWLSEATSHKAAITKAMYEESGGDYLAEHCLSNRYFKTPST